MTEKTRVLWIEDEPQTLEYLFYRLHTEYELDIYNINNNERALELSKDKWDVVIYDVGMDVSKTGYDLPVATKIKQNIEDTLFIGTSLCY